MGINKRLPEIDWSSYQHAYGKANDTPKHLTNLFSRSEKRAYTAIDELDSSLCHQRLAVSPALDPAFPFLIEALPLLSVENFGRLLELFADISYVTGDSDHFYPIRPLDLSWTSIPDESAAPTESYAQKVRQQLLINRGIFTTFLNHQNDYVFESASFIVANFTETPVETFEELQIALSCETNPKRRDSLFSGFCMLPFEGKFDYLIQAFHRETDNAVKSTIAGQIAYENKMNSPPEIVAFLSEQVLGLSEFNVSKPYGFFEDVGIPLALAQPDKYEAILQCFIEYMKHTQVSVRSTSFLAFALCWNGKPDFDQLDQLQLSAIETIYQQPKRWQYRITADLRYFSLPTSQDEMKMFLQDRKPYDEKPG